MTTSLSSSPMTPQWSDSSPGVMRPPTERRSWNWQPSVQRTTSLWTPRKPERSSSTSGSTAPNHINGEHVERVHTLRFLGVLISADISWSENTTTIIKKAQQRLHFLRVLRKHNLNPNLLLTFYHSSIESLLTYCITVWYGSCTAADRERLHRVIKAAQKIIGCPLPSLMDIYTTRCLSRATAIIKDSSHPASALFDLLPSGRRYRCIKARTNRLKNSFFPKAITTLNCSMNWFFPLVQYLLTSAISPTMCNIPIVYIDHIYIHCAPHFYVFMFVYYYFYTVSCTDIGDGFLISLYRGIVTIKAFYLFWSFWFWWRRSCCPPLLPSFLFFPSIKHAPHRAFKHH